MTCATSLGQFRTEVLLLDYVHLTAAELEEEIQAATSKASACSELGVGLEVSHQAPRQLFTRPGGEPPPAELSVLAGLGMP